MTNEKTVEARGASDDEDHDDAGKVIWGLIVRMGFWGTLLQRY